jgi:hypothetical protein
MIGTTPEVNQDFDVSSEHSSDSDYSSTGGPENLVEPVMSIQTMRRLNQMLKKVLPKLRRPLVKQISLSFSQAIAVRAINLGRIGNGTHKTIVRYISKVQPVIHRRLERRYHQLQLSKN